MKKSKEKGADLKPILRQLPGVVAFTGHMMDKVGRIPPRYVPRFPRQKEEAVTRAIRAALERLDARIGFCSAACGGDIIFIEEMLRRGGEVHVVLPYEEELFIRDCVQVPDGTPPEEHFQENTRREWLPRFRSIREKFASLTVLGKKRAQVNKRGVLARRGGRSVKRLSLPKTFTFV